MSNINGFIEINGTIHRITSVDDLKRAAQSLGKEFTDMTMEDYRQLCKEAEGHCDYEDDCGVEYQGQVLVNNYYRNQQYKIRQGTIAICKEAFFSYRVGQTTHFSGHEIKHILFPETLRYIDSDAFYYCDQLITLDFHLSTQLEFISGSAFKGCKSLTSVDLSGTNLKYMGGQVFKNCESLKTVSLPGSIEDVGSGLFEGCSKLEAIYIPHGTMAKFKELFPFDTDKLVELEEEPADDNAADQVE